MSQQGRETATAPLSVDVRPPASDCLSSRYGTDARGRRTEGVDSGRDASEARTPRRPRRRYASTIYVDANVLVERPVRPLLDALGAAAGRNSCPSLLILRMCFKRTAPAVQCCKNHWKRSLEVWSRRRGGLRPLHVPAVAQRRSGLRRRVPCAMETRPCGGNMYPPPPFD